MILHEPGIEKNSTHIFLYNGLLKEQPVFKRKKTQTTEKKRNVRSDTSSHCKACVCLLLTIWRINNMSHKGFCVYHKAHGMGNHFSSSLKEMVSFISDQVSEVFLFICTWRAVNQIHLIVLYNRLKNASTQQPR